MRAHNRKTQLLSFALALLLAAGLFTVSADYAAASSGVSVASVSGKTCRLTNGSTGIQYSAKSLKKGNAVKVSPISANSKYAKTIVYGKAHKWSAKTISKRLKKARKYNVSTKGFAFYSVKKGNKLRYIAYCKVPDQAPAKTAPKETAEVQAAEGTLDISVVSDDSSFCSEDYEFSALKMKVASDEYKSIVSPDAKGDVSLSVPAGEYDVDFITDCSEDSAFAFSSESYAVNVEAGEVARLEIAATPQPGYLYVYSNSGELPERVMVTGSSGKTEELPYDTSGDCVAAEGIFGKWLPADDYHVVIECGGKVYESDVHLSPARYCSAIF